MLEAKKLVGTDSQGILNVHCTTTKEGGEPEVCTQLVRRYSDELRVVATDKGNSSRWLRDTLR